MTGIHYSDEAKRRAAAMVQNGISRNKTAVILGIAKSTLWRWGTPAFPPTKPYPESVKEKVIKLYKSGLSRLDISIKLGVNVKRINKWLGRSRDGRPYKAYPPALKNKVRRLVKLGMQKTEIPNILGIGYPTVVRLTHDLKGDKSRVSGRYFKLLCKLINDGFILMRRKDLKIYKILKKHAYIRSAVFGKDALLFIRGGEKAAEKALLSKSKDISKRRLNTIKQVLLQQK
jgi:transposase-like protein